ncbi:MULTISPECIES: hypothetical protein [unclassified Flavobacterium]|uniref:hypothetical protein n=1 Tax=unclassified Flavobacterium TaxID=196869 RepID=UPI003618D3C7
MSTIKREFIWQHDQVLPYILHDLKEEIEKITPIEKIYLFGSRARKPFEEWNTLEGKDWDIIIQTKYKIINTAVWTSARNYHIDLFVLNENDTNRLLKSSKCCKELYPKYELEVTLNTEKHGNN